VLNQQSVPADIISRELIALEGVSPLWAKRFKLLMAYIWNNSDKPLPVAELAEQVHTSVFHFHRLFHAVFNEPVGSYVRKMKLLKAVTALVDTDTSVTDVAHETGFNSSQSLAKSLKQLTGKTPTQIRQAASQPGLDAFYDVYKALSASGEGQDVSEEFLNLRHEIFDREERRFECVEVEHATMERMEEAWKKRDRKPSDTMAILTYDDPQLVSYKDLVCCVGGELLDGSHVLPSGRYLTIKVRLTSNYEYYALWHSIEKIALREGYEFSDSPSLEVIENPFDLDTVMDMSIELKLKDRPSD